MCAWYKDLRCLFRKIQYSYNLGQKSYGRRQKSAEVTTKDDNDRKTYIGMTATTFKDRYRNHKKSFDDIKYENETELSKHVWKLKLSKKQYKINVLVYLIPSKFNQSRWK